MTSFNQNLLNENFGDDKEILIELVDVFFSELPNMISPIRKSIDENVSADLHLHAHTLKGAVSNFFAEKCVEHSFELEKMGRSGTIDRERANSLLKALEAELEGLSKDLRDYLA